VTPTDPTSHQTSGLPPLRTLIGFGRYLRLAGLPVGTGRILTFCRAVSALDALDRADLRNAARATLVSNHAHQQRLDVLFDGYFGRGNGGSSSAVKEDERRRPVEPAWQAPAEGDLRAELGLSSQSWSAANSDEELEGEAAIRIVASDAEVLRRKDFSALTAEERRRVFAAIRRLEPAIPLRASRRYRAASGGPRFDLRRTIRMSLRTEGEPFRRAWRTRKPRKRPMVLILDVSGSMTPYSRPLVEFAHAAATTGRRVEVFCFGTRLTHITRALRVRDPDVALSAVGAAVEDWEGGTRIGESLKQLLDAWSARSALRGSVVLLCSDGLERGDPELLRKQMERMSRLSYKVLWINPLKGSPRYEPLARGMAAALPLVDVFLPGHNLESLEALSVAVSLA
jgi:uncharacterized protein with von Willebrand factor type A (vWA) domain